MIAVKRACLSLLCVVLVAGCGSLVKPPNPGPTTASPSATIVTHGGPVPVHDPGHVTGHVTGHLMLFHGYRCHVEGKLPDPRCSPGAYDPQITTAVLCAPGYSTRSYRPPSSETSRFKRQVAYPAYGIPAGTRTELDHLVPLELGGANEASNLWPEPYPAAHAKDRVENRLHAAVCDGTVDLRAAQVAIASNWANAERQLGLTP
jgi:hypothetical protein